MVKFRSPSELLDLESRLGGLAKLMSQPRAGTDLSFILGQLMQKLDEQLAMDLPDEVEQLVRQMKARVAVAQARVAAVRSRQGNDVQLQPVGVPAGMPAIAPNGTRFH